MKAGKFEPWAVIVVSAALFAILGTLAMAVMAEPLSEHNEEQAAYNAAIKVLLSRGCTPEFARSRRYTVDVTHEAVTIVAKEVRQECKQTQAAAITKVWKHPTKRKDGSPLALSEIRGYQLTVDGVVTMLAPVTSWQMEGQPKAATIRTVDTSGNHSDPVSLL